MTVKKRSFLVSDAHAKLAAAVLIQAAREAKGGDPEAVAWLADPEGGLFFADALGYDLPLERWARRIEAGQLVTAELQEQSRG